MSLEETFEKWLAADLEAKKAAAEAPKSEPEYVTKADLGEMLKAFAAQVSTSIAESVEAVKTDVAEQVEKAMPVRAAGAGRVGGSESAESNEDPIEYLVKKGRTDEGWDDKDKELVTGLVVGALRQGWN